MNLEICLNHKTIFNSLEFINKIKDLELQESEILVSFDVCSLFPSVPVPQTMTYLRELLVENNLDLDKINEYVNLTTHCMSQNCFQINGKIYEQHEGTAMGNSLSPFVANLFMGKFETQFKNNADYFPRIWIRYVDDIFAVFDKTKYNIDDFVNQLNSKFPSINFTYEVENKGQLPFLDTLVIKNGNRLEFDVFRKETNVNSFITNDSNHCFQHKMAAFNFLVHRLLTFPLNPVRFQLELQNIKNIAIDNGYSPKIIDNLIRKRKFKLDISKSSTLLSVETKEKQNFIKIPFHNLAKGLNKVCKDANYKIVYSSNNRIHNLLGNPKDKVETLEKSGIYEIKCSHCNRKYVGQTKRSIQIRFKEHLAHFRCNRFEKSSVAEHILETGHSIKIDDLKLLQAVSSPRELNAYESIHIFKNEDYNPLNSDKGPISNSELIKMVKTTHDQPRIQTRNRPSVRARSQ